MSSFAPLKHHSGERKLVSVNQMQQRINPYQVGHPATYRPVITSRVLTKLFDRR